MRGDVDEIKSRLNIIDVLGQYLRLEKTGAGYRALCPFHNEKSPSFMVSEEKQIWHCFGCQKGGDIFAFVMEMEGIDFKEALKIMADKAGMELKSYNPQKNEKENRTLEILELSAKWYEYQLWNGPGKTLALSYLKERGLKDETIKEFRLGYAPKGWRNMLTFLTKRGYKIDEIAKTGLLVKKEGSQDPYDRFRDRIMFPIADYSGKVLGYSARVAPGGDETHAKYINTPESEVYHKSKVLYGIDKARTEIKQKDFVLLVEGNMDVIASHQAGMKNTVAVSGTALTSDQLKLIKRYTPKIKMFFDMDKAGEEATKKSVKAAIGEEFSVEVITLPEGKDAADIAKESPGKLLEAVANSKNFMEYFFETNFKRFDKKKVEDKKIIVKNLIDVIANFGSLVEKSHWIKILSQEIEIDEGTLTDMMKKVTLRERAASIGQGEGKNEIFSPKAKKEILADELTGLILVSKDAWEEAKKEEYSDLYLLKDSLLNALLGSQTFCDAEKNPLDLDPGDKARAEKLYFQQKYRFDLNNSIEEVVVSEPKKMFATLFGDIQKELKKETLGRLSRDLGAAEQKGDKILAKTLREEFQKISSELSVLLK